MEENLELSNNLFFNKIKSQILIYRKLILSLIIGLISLILIFFYLQDLKKNKLTEISNAFIEANVLITNNQIDKAKDILIKNIKSDNITYSILSLNTLIQNNLLNTKEQIDYYNLLINNKKIDNDLNKILIFKKTLIEIHLLNESQILNILKPLTQTENFMQLLALNLIGDYYYAKKEYIKASDFYKKILQSKIQNNFIKSNALLNLKNISSE